MREFRKPSYDWTMTFIELKEITKEVYGIEYDLQMGERGQGEYDVVTTGVIDSEQGYWKGINPNPHYGTSSLAEARFIELTDEEALEKWVSQKDITRYSRPFSSIADNGEYAHYQPEVAVILTDLAKRKEIPEGTYMITIDW